MTELLSIKGDRRVKIGDAEQVIVKFTKQGPLTHFNDSSTFDRGEDRIVHLDDAAQEELAEAAHLLDLSERRLGRLLSEAIGAGRLIAPVSLSGRSWPP
jgi:hypothetical protein